MPNLAALVLNDFRARYGADPAYLVRAPGRVNLIGEHTDYNDGFVMPIAIERATWVALRRRADHVVMLHSMDHQELLRLPLDGVAHGGPSWTEYPKGVAHVLAQAGHALSGWEGVTACDVPMGAGLSSSASFELAIARAFQVASDIAWDPVAMARLGQRAENEWVGVQCGIMDQLISAVGRAGHALLIDCRDLSSRAVPLPAGHAVVIMDTMTRRGLVGSAYNERRQQCQLVAAKFGVAKLRDVTLAQLDGRAHELEPAARRRAQHVISENLRTVEAAKAMEAQNATRLGALMNASHDSLRDDFEVTNHELNVIVDVARAHPACRGARMTGAGFGGCAVALVEASGLDDFSRRLVSRYAEQTGHAPTIYVTTGADGAADESALIRSGSAAQG